MTSFWFFSAKYLVISLLSTFKIRNKNFNYVSRFMPRVEIVQKHNTAARRLYIRGHNGKIYPYLVMNDACLTESRREERVLQLLRLLNPCLEKRKETTKRHLFFTGAIYWCGISVLYTFILYRSVQQCLQWTDPDCGPLRSSDLYHSFN